MNNEVLIIGAGKIGRGFIGQLLYRSGYKLWFVDASAEIVGLLNREKKYRVDVAKEGGDETEYVILEGAFALDMLPEIQVVMDRVSLMATSVGAANIEPTARFIGKMLTQRDPNMPLDWLICENASQPADKIRKVLLQDSTASFQEFVEEKLGLIETQILRTGMIASEEILRREPLAVRMQNWWTLPMDKDAFVGPIPEVTGFQPKANFKSELIRKLYTFNGTNGPIAYIGWANGYKILHEAALAFRTFFDQIQAELSHGLIREFGFDEAEQREFMGLAMKKYTDPVLRDEIERNARDLKRKVSREERLVGPAMLCLKHGRPPLAYAKAIAAAYHYHGSTDAGTQEVVQTVSEKGIEAAVQRYSGIPKENELYRLVLDAHKNQTFILK